MSVDVEIYLSELIKFFKQNPNDLLNLIPKEKENEFYSLIRKMAQENYDNGRDVTLTQSQLINICKDLNTNYLGKKTENIFFNTKFGQISLN
jgi:hypothetical protein